MAKAVTQLGTMVNQGSLAYFSYLVPELLEVLASRQADISEMRLEAGDASLYIEDWDMCEVWAARLREGGMTIVEADDIYRFMLSDLEQW